MMRSHKPRYALLAALVAGAAMVPSAPAMANVSGSSVAGAPKKVVSAYFADWDVYGRGYFVKDIPADKINVIQYAFGVPGFDPATGTASCNVLDPWADFQQAYAEVLSRCSTAVAPWYVVPADRKWYRNWSVGHLLLETLEQLNPQPPAADFDVDVELARLAGDDPIG